jgi:surface antigen
MGQAVAYAPLGQPIMWDNQGYGVQYNITPMRQYHRSGLVCRDYVAKAKNKGRKQQVHGTACQQGDGSWRVM